MNGRLLLIAAIIAETIAEQPEGAPNGVIYAGMQGVISYAEYMEIIAALKSGGLVTERFHVLHWVGPKGAVQ